MKAIVLSFDKYHFIAEHMMLCYKELWPNHPFTFRIPYQEHPQHLNKTFGSQVELIKTTPDIFSTLNNLLQDIDDDEWVYWCMDDRYPVKLDVHRINKIHNWIIAVEDQKIAGVGLTYNRRDWYNGNIMRNKSLVDIDRFRYFGVKNYSILWFHQFIRAKWLKAFTAELSQEMSSAKSMDAIKDKLILPGPHKRFVSKNRLAVFGESTNRGMLTPNCAKSMKSFGVNIPNGFEILETEIFKASPAHERSVLYYFIKYQILGKVRLF